MRTAASHDTLSELGLWWKLLSLLAQINARDVVALAIDAILRGA